VDFFLEEGSNEVVFNEINTMPGFTSISMYPMLWEEKGMSVPQLVERLIQYALVRE
jgi:D-alanine-D-alanine ligase